MSQPGLDLVDSYLKVIQYPTVVSVSDRFTSYEERYQFAASYQSIRYDVYLDSNIKACPVDIPFKSLLILDLNKVLLRPLKRRENMKKFDIIYVRCQPRYLERVRRSFGSAVQKVLDDAGYVEVIIFDVRLKG